MSAEAVRETSDLMKQKVILRRDGGEGCGDHGRHSGQARILLGQCFPVNAYYSLPVMGPISALSYTLPVILSFTTQLGS